MSRKDVRKKAKISPALTFLLISFGATVGAVLAFILPFGKEKQ